MPLGAAKPLVSLQLAESTLHRADVPADWKLTPERFQRALERSAAQRFAPPPDSTSSAVPQPSAQTVEAYLSTLNLADLALACACSDGTPAAWNRFVADYRPQLQKAARAIAGDSGSRELADSIYAELYGLRESAAGERKSPFDYFLGRSKLSTWLHAILSQRHIDQIRSARKTESLDDAPGERHTEIPSTTPPVDTERERYVALLQHILSTVISALDPRDRLRLAYYYVDELTLAQIGKLFGEHEATVSRKLDKTRREVRDQVTARLREERKLSEAQVQLCYDYAREKWPFDLAGVLSVRD